MLLSGKGRAMMNSIACQFRRGDVHFCLLKSVGILPLTSQGEIGLELGSPELNSIKLLLISSKFSLRQNNMQEDLLGASNLAFSKWENSAEFFSLSFLFKIIDYTCASL